MIWNLGLVFIRQWVSKRKDRSSFFIKKQKGDILLVQVYFDDIIFGSISKELCTEFEKLMHDKFQMSFMGELNFFLGLQVKQREDGIFISQDKYVAEILRKFGFTDVRTASTPMDTEKPLLKDSDVAYSDSDYGGASLDRKSTTGSCQFLGCRLISWQCKKKIVLTTTLLEADYVDAASCCGLVTMGSKSNAGLLVGDEAVHKELGDRMEKAATTASSLEAEQDSEQFWQIATASTLEDGDMGITATIDGKVKGEGSTIPVESHHTPTSAPSTSQPPTSSPSMPTTHVAKEAALMSHDSPLPRTYGVAYTKLIMKVKKLENKVKSIKARRKVRLVISNDEDDLEDPSKQGRKIAQIDKDEGITLVRMGVQTQGRSDKDLMYETGVYDYPEGFTGPSISITTTEPVTTAGEGVSTARAIPEEVSTAELDMDVTLAEAVVDL
ncbi:putative ribonuclease H-like domain-containing protein [Tanacetum coccineum]